MGSFKDFLRWYNNKDVVPTSEALQKMIDFYHDKDINMLKCGCTLPNLANISLHKSTNAKFYPFTEGDEDLLQKNGDVVGGPSIVFTRKSVVDETLPESRQTFANLLLGLMRANYTPTRCVNLCPLVFIRVVISIQNPEDSPSTKQDPFLWKYGHVLFSTYKTSDCKIESFYTTGGQKKFSCFSFDRFCSHCNTVFESMVCYHLCCPCQDLGPFLTEEDFKRGSRKRELDEMIRGYIQEKSFTVIEMWECELWRLYKTTTIVKLQIRENFPNRRWFTEHQLLERRMKGNLFGYVQCDFEVHETLRANFANFPTIFKNTLLSKNDIGDLMQT